MSSHTSPSGDGTSRLSGDKGIPQTQSSKQLAEKKSFGSRAKQAWAAYHPTLPQLCIMAKGALPPTIVLAMYQATAVADIYTTLGYLLAVVSILSVSILPRALFLQTILLDVIAICIASAVNLLAIYCVVQARLRTTPRESANSAGSPSLTPGIVTYNSSASAVSGIWLFLQLYVINVMRAKYPQIALPSIMYSINAIVGSTNAPRFPTMAVGIAFVVRMLKTFLTGLGVGVGVSLLIFPTSSRKIVFIDITAYIGSLQGTLESYKTWLFAVEEGDTLAQMAPGAMGGKHPVTKEVAAVRAHVAKVAALHGKLQADLPFAKREVAYGKLGPADLKELNDLLRSCMLPIVGLTSLINMFERLIKTNHWTAEDEKQGLSPETLAQRQELVDDWKKNMAAVHRPTEELINVMKDGFEHAMIRLELKKSPNKHKTSTQDSGPDLEAGAYSSEPGEKGFAKHLESKIDDLHSLKKDSLRDWCARKGIELPVDFFDSPTAPFGQPSNAVKEETIEAYRRRQRQLYALLYIEYLLYHGSLGIRELVRYADNKVETHQLKAKLIVPGPKRLKSWLRSLFRSEGLHQDQGLGELTGTQNTIYMGSAYNKQQDPEHLRPTTMLERVGDVIRYIPRFLRSPESAFGLRVAIAAMCIGVVNLLADTQEFFNRQRLLWAMIMIAISMSPTAGQSTFAFVLRILGTVIAMVVSLVVYYIPDGHTAGILVFMWLTMTFGVYIIIKFPPFIIIGMIYMVTIALILGYELEVRKIGVRAAETSGQVYYPIYELAPYRLATVSGGLFVAWFWTIFPYPMTEHSQLRQNIGRALYLLANFYSIVHETIVARLKTDRKGLVVLRDSADHITKMRLKLFAKMLSIIASLKQDLKFIKWEVPIGGRFPTQIYANIVTDIEHITNYIALIGYASRSFLVPKDEEGASSRWLDDFSRVLVEAGVTTHEITSLLSLLSASIKNGQSLPPYMTVPQPYELSAKMEALDSDILSIRHINEPGYATFAVVQTASRCVIADLDELLQRVKELVGELDFSFRIARSDESLDSASTDTLGSKNKHD